MEKNNESKKGLSRRKFLGSTAALAAFTMVPLRFSSKGQPVAKASPDAKPDSKFGGVQMGAITYSWRDQPSGAENIIKYCLAAGISSIELMSGDLEEYLGAPKNPMMAMFAPPPPQPKAPAGTPEAKTPPPQRRELTQEQKDTIAKYNTEMKAWRLALPISKFEGARKLFDDAGINIHIVKFSPARWSDEEIDYAFKAAKIMGAKGLRKNCLWTM